MVTEFECFRSSKEHVGVKNALYPCDKIFAAKLTRMKQGRNITFGHVFELFLRRTSMTGKRDLGEKHIERFAW